MSLTSDLDDSCESYSPSLVEMITSFVKSNTGEAEIRAHKSLTILQTKDLQLQHLQDRIDHLEELANKKDGLVPKLQLEQLDSVRESENTVTRDTEEPTPHRETSLPPVLLIPQDFLGSSPDNIGQDEHFQTILEEKEEVVSACHERWQHVVERLEQYNKQLEADLKYENKLRLKDKQKYSDALAGVSDALYDVKIAMDEVKRQRGHVRDSNCIPHGSRKDMCEKDVKQSMSKTSNKKIKQYLIKQFPHEDKPDHNHNENKEQFIGNLQEAQETIADLQKHVKEAEKMYKNECCARKNLEKKLSEYHRSVNSSASDSTVLSSSRKKKKNRSHSVLKRKPENKFKLKKLQQKCNQFQSELKKMDASYKKLEAEMVNLNEKHAVLQAREADYKVEVEKKDEIIKELKEKLVKSPTSEVLKGRLDAAAQVMTKQHKQIKQAEQECQESRQALESLRKRLSRAETLNSKRETLAETCRKQQSDTEIKLIAEQEKNKNFTYEMLKLKDINASLNSQINNLKQQCEELINKKNKSEANLTEMKSIMEQKLNSLSEALNKKLLASEQSETVLQDKLSKLRAQFVTQMREASYKIASADTKIQELFGGIELFLKMLLGSKSYTSTLNSPQAEEAVQEVCEILNLSPAQMQNMVNSASTSNCENINWLQQCYQLVHLEEFSEKLGHLLFNAVNSMKKY